MRKTVLSLIYIGAFLFSILIGNAVWASPAAGESLSVDSYKASEPYSYPSRDDTVFAGWFCDDTFEVAYRETTGTATAKFVDKDILSVKYQLTVGANDAQEYTKLRIITTVDSLKYRKVGFRIEYAGNVLDKATTNVYKTLTGTDGVTGFNYSPTVFSPDSAYFCAYNVKVMQNRFDTELDVTPYWITLDGTRVEGEERTIKINAAQVNSGTKYSTLYDAVAAASSGDTVTLLQDQAVSSVITLDKNLAIAGNYTVTHPESDSTILAVSSGKTLTVSNGVILSGAVSMGTGSTLSVQGSASIGTADAGIDPEGGITVTGSNANGSIVLENTDLVTISGTGEGSAFIPLWGHNRPSDDNASGIGNLSMGEAFMCSCGKVGDHEHIGGCAAPATAWTAWPTGSILPTDRSSGAFYLTGAVRLNGVANFSGSKSIILDLAGNTVLGKEDEFTVIRTGDGTALTIADSVGGGKVQCRGSFSGNNIGRVLDMWPHESSSIVNLYGGTLCAAEGATGDNGTVSAGYGSFNMYGGTILPVEGSSDGYSNAVSLGNPANSNFYGDLSVYGGTIKGEVLMRTSSTMIDIRNDAQVGISDGSGLAYGIDSLRPAMTIDCTDATGAVVLKNSDLLGISGTGEGSAFTSLWGHNRPSDDNASGIGNLSMGEAFMCSCGKVGDHEHMGNCAVPADAWQLWSSNSLPDEPGSYYLANDITVTAGASITSTSKLQINIDLAGHTIDGQGNVDTLYTLMRKTELNITDSAGGGRIRNSRNSTAGSVVLGSVVQLPNGNVNADATLNLYGGMLASTGASNGSGDYDCTVYLGTGTFNLYGGTVRGNCISGDKYIACRQYGNLVNVYGGMLDWETAAVNEQGTDIRVGFGKADITPDTGVSLGAYGNDDVRLTRGVLSRLYTLALVITDQDDNTFVLVVSDTVYSSPKITEMVRTAVNSAYGIPKENIIDAGTHNHNGPSVGYESEANNAYWADYAEAVTQAVGEALADRQTAVIEIGRTQTDALNFSRRYVRSDGNYIGGGPDKWNVESTAPIVAHESEADEEIQMVRFVRAGKDILLTNWQSHACNIDGSRDGELHYMASGEWPAVMRDVVEEELDVHCMYIQGAAGNMACMSRISGEFAVEDYRDYQAIGERLAGYVVNACSASGTFEEIRGGGLQTDHVLLPVDSTDNTKPELYTIALGDLSFVTFGPELFDTEAKKLKEETPFAMTVIVGYTAHSGGYVAPDWAWDHGCYEVNNTRFARGSSEKIFEYFLGALRKHKEDQKTVFDEVEEKKVLKILTLGHSLALDAGHMLNLICNAQGMGDYEEVDIATLYYDGCTLIQHVNFLQNASEVYDLYYSSTKDPSAPPVNKGKISIQAALAMDYWDVIVMQDGVFKVSDSASYTDGRRQILQNFINQNKLNANARLMWNMTWVPPTDTTLMDKYPRTPNVYYTNYEAFNNSRTEMYNAVVGNVSTYIAADTAFSAIIPCATAFEDALSGDLEETDIYRDYVHATDFGRVIASYTWYCRLMGIDSLDSIRLSAIPAAFLNSTPGTDDVTLTLIQKAVIRESVNNALAHPFEMTQSRIINVNDLTDGGSGSGFGDDAGDVIG